jgi:hypothetical protein
MLKKTLFAFIAAALVGAIALPPESAFAGREILPGGRQSQVP